MKLTILKDLMLQNIITKRHNQNYNININGKNFHDQQMHSNIKQYEEIRKSTTRQGEDYTTGCLID